MKEVDQGVGLDLSVASPCISHVDQALRDVNLIVWLQHNVFFSVSFFDHAFQIDGQILPALPRHFDFALVCEVSKTAGPNHGLACSVALVGGNFLRTLSSNRSVDINFTARLFAYAIKGKDDSSVIIIIFLERSS